MIPWIDLSPILGDIPWVVVGAVAARAYMPERATQDLDILVRQEDGERVREKLQAAGFQVTAPLAIPGYTFRSPEGMEIDVLLGDFPWLEEALAHPRLDPAGLPVLDLPFLVLMKLEASRVQDLADLSRMLGLASEEDLERVRDAVSRYAPDDREDLESLVYLGRLELAEEK